MISADTIGAENSGERRNVTVARTLREVGTNTHRSRNTAGKFVATNFGALCPGLPAIAGSPGTQGSYAYPPVEPSSVFTLDRGQTLP